MVYIEVHRNEAIINEKVSRYKDDIIYTTPLEDSIVLAIKGVEQGRGIANFCFVHLSLHQYRGVSDSLRKFIHSHGSLITLCVTNVKHEEHIVDRMSVGLGLGSHLSVRSMASKNGAQVSLDLSDFVMYVSSPDEISPDNDIQRLPKVKGHVDDKNRSFI